MRIVINIIIAVLIIAVLIICGLAWIGSRALAGKDSKLTKAIAVPMSRVLSWAKSGNKAAPAAA